MKTLLACPILHLNNVALYRLYAIDLCIGFNVPTVSFMRQWDTVISWPWLRS